MATNGEFVAENGLESPSLHFSCNKAVLSPSNTETCPIEQESPARTCEIVHGAKFLAKRRYGDFPGAWKVAVLAFPPPPLLGIGAIRCPFVFLDVRRRHLARTCVKLSGVFWLTSGDSLCLPFPPNDSGTADNVLTTDR